MQALSTSERAELAKLEAVIAKGNRAFQETARALAEIRDRRLYRQAGYKNFRDYCHERWRFSEDRGHALVRAARVLQLTALLGLPPPQSVKQADRAFKMLNPERKRGNDLPASLQGNGNPHLNVNGHGNGTNGNGKHPGQAQDYMQQLEELLAHGERFAGERAKSVAGLTVYTRTRNIRSHVAELERIADLHPHAAKARALLRYYLTQVLPWPA